LCEPSPHCITRHEVDERALAVDLDDRQELAVARLELGIAVDLDLLQLEAELVPKPNHGFPRALAEVAPLRAVETNLGYGYRPRVVVASATRFTASP
jgi:hypothetical protein